MKQYQNTLTICILSLVIVLSVVAPDIMRYLGWAILGMAVVFFLIVIIWSVSRLYLTTSKEYWEKESAKLQVITAPPGQQVFVKSDPRAHYHALHLERRAYSNGQFEEPTPGESQAWLHFHQKGAAPSKVLPVDTESLKSANPPPQLLPLLADAWKVFLVGNEGSGKTTLLRALVGQRLAQGPVIIVDIHGHKDHWPGAKVVGTGYDLESVMTTFDRLTAEIKKRYDAIGQRADAAESFTPITILCDEFSALVFNLKKAGYDISEFMRMMSTEVRKTKVSFIFASHVETLVGTGMDGAAKLLDSFVKVKLNYDQISGDRTYSVDFGDGGGPREVQSILPLMAFSTSPKDITGLELAAPKLNDDEEMLLAYINECDHTPTPRELIIKALGIDPSKIGSQHYTRVRQSYARLDRLGLLSN